MVIITAQSIETGIVFSKGAEIVRVDYAHTKLQAFVLDLNTESEFVVEFSKVIGFRVLDEGYLNEYWPECSASNGWLFEIHSGGWLSQETNKLLVDMNSKGMEYFIAGENDCLSVISNAAPSVHKRAL
ncbi:hypothetical protein [Sulfuriferula multivorans]|uniref:hypothetical protein n=1 Tax=Sulfuriferula multivorans TaxID=1559896 RepID=UPI000F5C288B|nr:hypothetical protein [Sulfuriferula multivorans]